MDIKEKLPHKIVNDLRKVLDSKPRVKKLWDNITPIAKNEFICWVMSAQKQETREHRIKRLCDELLEGKRRPCCWAGCPHRK